MPGRMAVVLTKVGICIDEFKFFSHTIPWMMSKNECSKAFFNYHTLLCIRGVIE
jgi:hypothetical protein